MSQDPVSAAAAAIADLCDLGPEGQRAVADAIYEHVPFTPGVAYMPVPRCESCRHWKQRAAKEGECYRPALEGALMCPPGLAPMLTAAGFGCVHWEAKP